MELILVLVVFILWGRKTACGKDHRQKQRELRNQQSQNALLKQADICGDGWGLRARYFMRPPPPSPSAFLAFHPDVCPRAGLFFPAAFATRKEVFPTPLHYGRAASALNGYH